MDKKLKKAIKDDIGKRGDRGVSEVLRVVEEECYDLSRHVLENWQDKPLSNFWNATGNAIENIAFKVELEFGYGQHGKHVK